MENVNNIEVMNLRRELIRLEQVRFCFFPSFICSVCWSFHRHWPWNRMMLLYYNKNKRFWYVRFVSFRVTSENTQFLAISIILGSLDAGNEWSIEYQSATPARWSSGEYRLILAWKNDYSYSCSQCHRLLLIPPQADIHTKVSGKEVCTRN